MNIGALVVLWIGCTIMGLFLTIGRYYIDSEYEDAGHLFAWTLFWWVLIPMRIATFVGHVYHQGVSSEFVAGFVNAFRK